MYLHQCILQVHIFSLFFFCLLLKEVEVIYLKQSKMLILKPPKFRGKKKFYSGESAILIT